MERSRLERISELTALSRERPLTPEEQSEREALRAEYLEEWRRSAAAVLDNTYILTPDGVKHKLKKRGEAPDQIRKGKTAR